MARWRRSAVSWRQTCPGVVQALNLFAHLNPGISHTMIDGALFPEEVDHPRHPLPSHPPAIDTSPAGGNNACRRSFMIIVTNRIPVAPGHEADFDAFILNFPALAGDDMRLTIGKVPIRFRPITDNQ